MKTLPGFGLAGAIAIGVSLSTFANAETVLTVNGADIDSSVIDLYIESRSQRPAAQVVGAERDSLIEELTDIYLLSTQPRADELASEGRTAAQLELQKRGILAQVVATDFIANNTAETVQGSPHPGRVAGRSRRPDYAARRRRGFH